MVETQSGAAVPATRRDFERIAAQPLSLPVGPYVATPFPPDPYGERTRRSAKKSPHWLNRSEQGTLRVALPCTIAVCALLVIYLAEYAQVTRLGLEQSAIRTQLRNERLEYETLRAQYSILRSPGHIAEVAAGLHMVRGAQRMVYISGSQQAMPEAYSPVGTTAASASDTAALGVTNGGIDSQTIPNPAAAD